MNAQRGWAALALAAGLVCAGCLGGPKVAARVTSVGVSPKMDDVGMTRDRAEGRAKRSLVRLLKVGAVEFEYRAAEGASALRLIIGPEEVGLVNTRFTGLPKGVVAYASGQRRPEVVAAMTKLETIKVGARVDADDPDRAYRLAESRALRKAVRWALGPKADQPVYARGRLTLVDAQEKVDEAGARVAYWAHVQLAESGRLSEDEIQPLLRAALDEHESLGEWALAAQNLERSMKGEFIPSAEKLARLASLYHRAGDLKRADEKYQAAEKVAIDLDTLRAHLKVVEALGDGARAADLKRRIAEVEQMKGGKLELPGQKPLDLPEAKDPTK